MMLLTQKEQLFDGKNGTSPWVTASEIGSAKYCPRSLYLRLYGATVSFGSRLQQLRGTQAHIREAVRTVDRRCFVASYVLGPEHVATNRLRAWRDRMLQAHWYGRLLIEVYYTASPLFIWMMRQSRWLRGIARRAVINIARRVGRT